MKTLVSLSLSLVGLVVLSGCSQGSSDAAAAAAANPASAPPVTSTVENTAPTGKTYNAPQEGAKAYRITPADPSKFPSNAAGGDK